MAASFVRIKFGSMSDYITFNFNLKEVNMLWDISSAPQKIQPIEGLEDPFRYRYLSLYIFGSLNANRCRFRSVLSNSTIYRITRSVCPNSDVEDLVLAAKMNGTSTASEKRNQVLREKYKDLKIGDTMITDLVSESKQLAIPEVPVFANTINESMRSGEDQIFHVTVWNRGIINYRMSRSLICFSNLILFDDSLSNLLDLLSVIGMLWVFSWIVSASWM